MPEALCLLLHVQDGHLERGELDPLHLDDLAPLLHVREAVLGGQNGLPDVLGVKFTMGLATGCVRSTEDKPPCLMCVCVCVCVYVCV